MWVAYTAKIGGIIECWQYYRVCEDYNGVVSKILGDEWVNPQILSVQSLEAHQRAAHYRAHHHVNTQQCQQVAVTLDDKVPYVSYGFYKAKGLQPY